MAVNVEYVKSVQGILKIFELISICIAFSCLADLNSELNMDVFSEFPVRFDFFMAVFVIGWVVVLSVFLVSLFSSVKEKDWSLVLLIVSVLFALLFFIASGLMADILKDWYDAGLNKFPFEQKFTKIFTVSVAFGFGSGVLLAVDGFLSFSRRKTGAN